MSPPDGRGWTAIGLFATFWAMLGLLAWVPSLAKDDTFKSLLVMVVGAVLLVGKYYYGSSKQDKPPE